MTHCHSICLYISKKLRGEAFSKYQMNNLCSSMGKEHKNYGLKTGSTPGIGNYKPSCLFKSLYLSML